ncbi:FAD dependent oxidoreductase [Hyphomicrobium denitrificans 1NES1]|uniref:FAD dependent oxidoreductase n=1 Tax=Hyphomicrobium denitrificans 1NES1 TaxID=670307 RepID=N0BF58_9HYPH|nr:FAD dependent oxidoreductase [Hyphomicrobium denitrificans 1NES1]
MSKLSIAVVGAGITGLWQAYTHARAGHRVRLVEQSSEPFAACASRLAAAMIAPECEAEGAPAVVRDLGRESIVLWHKAYPGTIVNGTLVVAPPRDSSDLTRFEQMTERHEVVAAHRIAKLEPDLSGRFERGLFFPDEAHVVATEALEWLLCEGRTLGVATEFGQPFKPSGEDVAIDCRGIGARQDLPLLRGVRGERILIQSHDVGLSRPVRLLHPRQSIYIVPQGDGRYVIGASLLEREDDSPMTVKSALDLLGTAYALHPAFGEAAILDMGAGVRPAFPDNVPRALVEDGGRTIRVNGTYRHGFLLAPVLAQAVGGFLSDGRRDSPLFDSPRA